jgi:hypothetical protein
MVHVSRGAHDACRMVARCLLTLREGCTDGCVAGWRASAAYKWAFARGFETASPSWRMHQQRSVHMDVRSKSPHWFPRYCVRVCLCILCVCVCSASSCEKRFMFTIVCVFSVVPACVCVHVYSESNIHACRRVCMPTSLCCVCILYDFCVCQVHSNIPCEYVNDKLKEQALECCDMLLYVSCVGMHHLCIRMSIPVIYIIPRTRVMHVRALAAWARGGAC